MTLSITDIIGVLIIYQSLVFGFSLLINKKTKPLFVKVLLAFSVIIIVHFGYMLFEKFGDGDQILLGPFFGLLYGPIYFIYSKSLILKTFNPKRNGIHFVPAVITLIVLFTFGNQFGNIFNTIGIVVTIHFIFYLCFTLILLYRYRKQLKNTISSFYNISLFWLEIIIYLQFIAIVFMLLESYFQSTINTNSFILIIYILVLILIHCFYYLGLKQVRLFKGFESENIKTLISKRYSISDDLFNEYLHKLNTYITREKPYLEFNISLQDLSEKLSISPRNLSHVINKNFKRNFYDFINNYRLEQVKEYLKESNKPIKEIMYESGFSNKATFNSIFKKDTGLTPTQFRAKHKS